MPLGQATIEQEERTCGIHIIEMRSTGCAIADRIRQKCQLALMPFSDATLDEHLFEGIEALEIDRRERNEWRVVIGALFERLCPYISYTWTTTEQ